MLVSLFFSVTLLLPIISSSQPILIGPLTTLQHQVSGILYALNQHTLLLHNFTYDGKGPAAVFWLDAVPSAAISGVIPLSQNTCTIVKRLPAFSGQTVLINLPPHTAITDFAHFSVWCKAIRVSFGGVDIDAQTAASVPQSTPECDEFDGRVHVFMSEPQKRGLSDSNDRQDTTQPCKVNFKGEEKEYGGCVRGLDGDVDVYWTLREVDGELDTLFRAPTEGGYVGFGWAYSEMTGSNAVVAYANAAGEAVIDDYFLRSKTSAGVRPAGNQRLLNVDADVEGKYVAGIFTRKLAVEGLPSITKGTISAIWSVGSMPSSRTSLEYYESARGIVTIDLSIGVDAGTSIEPSESPSEEEADVDKPEESPFDPEDGSSVLPSPSEETVCMVEFKGEERIYDGCRKGFTGDVEVYWTMRGEDGEIDTLFRAPTEGGYVGFGWGFRQMVGSSVIIAFEGDSGAEISGYFLENKSSQGVQPNNSQPLTNMDAHFDGTFVAGTFTRKINLEDFGATRDGRAYAILAVGERPDSPTSLEKHAEHSIETIDLSSAQQAPLPASTPTPSSSGVPEDLACRVTFKGETTNFTSCVKGLAHDVEVYWTLREEDGELDTLFRAPTEGGYVGFGWGYSDMVGSKAVIAYQGAGADAVIDSYRLTSESTEDVQPESHGITDMEASIDDEFVAGFFTRKLELEGLPTIRNGETECIWAVGSRPSSATSLRKHNGRAHGQIDLSKGNLNILSGGEFGPVFVAHGVLMVVAWLVIVPLGVISMRYLKRYNPTAFQLHRGLNLSGVVLALVALVLAYTQGSHTETAHLVVGTIVGFLMILQVAGGLLRPNLRSARRRVWYAGHGGSGYTALALAMANVWVGLSIIGAELGYYIVCGALVGVHVLLHVVLSLMPGKFPVEERKGVTSEEDEALVGGERERNDPGPQRI